MAENFNGEKILLSSEKLIFNTTLNDIEFNSKGIIHLTARDSLRIDIGSLGSTNPDNLLIVNSPRIQFGLATKGREVEPVVKGKALEKTLGDLMNAIEKYSKFVAASVPEYSSVLTMWANQLKQDFTLVRMDLAEEGNVSSDITYTI